MRSAGLATATRNIPSGARSTGIGNSLVKIVDIVAALLRFGQKKRKNSTPVLSTVHHFRRKDGSDGSLLRQHLCCAPFTPSHVDQPDCADHPAQDQRDTHTEQ
jgi:hypothetical protein